MADPAGLFRERQQQSTNRPLMSVIVMMLWTGRARRAHSR